MKNNYRADDINERLNNAGYHPLDVMVTGVTGAGKSSTLNMLFEKEVAAVGRRADPTNMYIEPKAPNINQWAYDSTAKCKCLKRGSTKAGGNGSGCRDYSCKIPLN